MLRVELTSGKFGALKYLTAFAAFFSVCVTGIVNILAATAGANLPVEPRPFAF